MFQIERQEKILQYVNQRKRVYNAELCEKFDTSVVTIRNDLNELAKKDLLVKTFGGAIALEERLNMEIPYQTKYKKNMESKRKIAQIAASLIEDNDVIILDSGSTTLEIAKSLGNRALTVITNDLQVGLIVATHPKVKLIIPGGTVMHPVYTLLGQDTVRFFERIEVNKLFLGIDALHFEDGITNRTLDEVDLKRTMMRASKQVIGCADSSKFGQKVFAKLCGPSEIDILITEKINKKDAASMSNLGVKVITPDKADLDSKSE